MVLVVSLDSQITEACLRNVYRKRNLAKGAEVAIINHNGLGLENLPRHFIKWHGVCHPPRCVDARTGEPDKAAATAAKEQYGLVRLPPYYAVQWNPNHPKGGPMFQESKYNNHVSRTEGIGDSIKVCFN